MASASVAITCLEIALRLTDFSRPAFFQTDPVTGQWHRPNAQGWSRDEGESYVRINSEGLRDREHAKPKAAGVFRVAVLGDSLTEALQLPMEQAYWYRLEQTLASSCSPLRNRRVEVLNFGHSGFGTAQELLTLRHRVWDYSPDLIVLGFFTGNDIRNNARDLELDNGRPFFQLRNGRLELDNSFRDAPTFLRHSGAWRESLRTASDSIRILQLARLAWSVGVTEAANAFGEAGLDEEIYRPPSTSAWADAWSVTEAILLQMRDEVSARNSRFVVMTMSNGIQVDPDPAVRRAFAESIGATDLFYPDTRLAQFAASSGIDMLSLAQPLSEFAEKNQVYVHGFSNTPKGQGHWNSRAHQFAGDALSRRVCESVTSGNEQ